MSTDLIPWFLNLDGNRFEYEFNMLLEAKKVRAIKSLKSLLRPFYLEENKFASAPSVIPSVFTALLSLSSNGCFGLSHWMQQPFICALP